VASNSPTPTRSEHPRRLGRPRGGVRKEDRLEDVLAVATGLDQIADELGVTRAALYYYFDTKQELLEEICSRSQTAVESALQEVQALPDAAERLRAFARAFARNTATDASRVFFRDASELSPGFREQIRERAHRVTRGAEEIIEAGIASGRFRRVEVQVAAPGLLALLNSLPDWVRPTRHGELKDVTEQLLDVYLRGICLPDGE
jgi:AcrR family transcriptional regulator